MAAVSAPQPPRVDLSNQQSSTHLPPRGRPRRARASRTNVDDCNPRSQTSNRPEAEVTSSPLSMRPASVAPSGASSTNNQERSGGRLNSRGKRQRGTGRGGRGGASIPSRQFGGTLTNHNRPNTSTPLQGDAPEFVPGQAPTSQPQSQIRSKPQRQRAPSKSNAPDIATRIHQDIDHGQYECPICTNEVFRNSKVWSCHKCWTVFHLHCVKQWASNHDAVVNHQENGQSDESSLRQWRCPGCNLAQDFKPSHYSCWCGKESNPRSIPGLPPHSCGNTCGKTRIVSKCPHPCELACHAGPCPPCTRDGPTQACFCGKQSKTRKCLDTDYENGWSCDEICGDLMPCGEHTCQQKCHEGLCGACEVQVDARCYCGQEQKAILCCDREDDISSTFANITSDGEAVTEHWIGRFKCRNACNRNFDCNVHHCTKQCHPHDGPVAHCLRSPDLITCCPCGKNKLSDISDKVRQTCEDPIPSCKEPCLKTLQCGHKCRQICHSGDCGLCSQKITINCRCGKQELQTVCHQGIEQSPQCTRTCHVTLHCGRHSCGERCCAGERKATERQASKRKQLRPLNSTQLPSLTEASIYEPEHICTRICGRPLKCGNHTCQDLCHKGPCPSCREAIFDELACSCGRTILQPPLPCGTKNPSCRYDCERPKSCGHPQVQHTCHPSTESCPRCPFFVSKPCLCGKKVLANQQCWFSDVRCGEPCKAKLKCGAHSCQKTCHKPGECEDNTTPCTQPCAKPLKTCGHPCSAPCHAPYPCKEDSPCTHKIIITCACQTQKLETRCAASKASPEGNSTKSLKCTDECARLARNRQLASALSIDPATHTIADEHIPYSTETLTLYQDAPKTSSDHELTIRAFAADLTQRRLRFKPLPASQRTFLHSLAEDYGLDSESLDPEPFRHVALFKTPRFVSPPAKTLRDCVRIRRSQQATLDAEASAHAAAKAKAAAEARRGDEWNALLLVEPRFGLTADELADELAAIQGPSPKARLEARFLVNGEVVVHSRVAESAAREMQAPVSRSLIALGVCAGVLACRFNPVTGRVSRREGDAGTSAGGVEVATVAAAATPAAVGGWSQVAAKGAVAASKRVTAAPVGVQSSFTVLGNGNAGKKKKKPEREKLVGKESVAEDWEEEAEKEEAEVNAGGEQIVDAQVDDLGESL